MTAITRRLPILAACMAGSIAAAFAAGASRADTPAMCEIATTSRGGMVSIEALAHARGATTGSYSLSITGAGTNISQGGDFDARAGETVTLGSASLGGSARGYEVKLSVTASGETARCSETISARL